MYATGTGLKVNPQNQLIVSRIIFAAMVFGLVAFSAVAIVVGPVTPTGGEAVPVGVLQLACAAFMVMQAVVYLVVRTQMIRRLRERGGTPADDEIARVFLSIRVVGLAMAEGAGLFGAVIVLLGGAGPSVLLIAVPLAAMLIQFPTDGKWQTFHDRMRHGEVR